jgi:PAS domain S-box-containing protein
MQFLPATFAMYDRPVPPGRASPPSPYDPADAVYAAARDLCARGAAAGRDLPAAARDASRGSVSRPDRLLGYLQCASLNFKLSLVTAGPECAAGHSCAPGDEDASSGRASAGRSGGRQPGTAGSVQQELGMMDMTKPAARKRAGAVPTPDRAVIDMTQSGVVTSWGPAAALLYGYLEEEIVGRGADVLCPEGLRAEEEEVLRRVTAEGRIEHYEADRVRKDGTVVRVSVTASPVISAAGAVVGVSAVSQEASGQQASQAQGGETTASERRGARDAQERTDVRADTQRRDARHVQERVDVQASTQRRGARDAQERTDVRADTQRRDARHVQERIDAQTSTQRRSARNTQDKVEAAQDSQRRSARNTQDKVEAAQDSQRRDAQDLSDERHDSERREALQQNEGLRAQVRQSQRMESLGQLAGGVAHDFNNILGIILSYATFVSDRLDVAAGSGGDGSWDEARADMAQILQAVDRGGTHTRQLLAFASREAIRPLALDLNEVIGGVEELLRRAIGEHIVLTTSLAEGLQPVLADAGKIEQVLVNLAVNARDAMPGGGTLTIATENITTAAGSAGGDGQERHVRLQVSDTGTGMAADIIEHVFEPFFTTKGADRGTGLGLATVYGILTQAGGDIQISSQPGNGTTFTIVLPVTSEAAAPARQLAPVIREARGETVLIVEDETELREATKRILSAAGYHVIAAASGPDALEIACQHEGPVHLLITDIVMPDMLGPEVAERVRVIKPGAAVLYMSGYGWPVLASRGRLPPDAILLDKPFSAADMLDKAGQALSGVRSREVR